MTFSNRLLGLLLLLVLFSASPALAHKVNIFAFVESGTVFTESYFADGKPVIDGKVQVFDSEDELLLEGHSDRQGMWQFSVPKHEDLTLVVNAGLGHKGTFRLKKSVMGR